MTLLRRATAVWVLLLAGSFRLCAQPPGPPQNGEVWSDSELQWMARNPVLRVAVDTRLEPFDFISQDGRHRGLASDYLQRIAEQTGLQIEVVYGRPWEEMMQEVDRGIIHAVACAISTEGLRQRFLFSTPYASFPTVIISREEEESFISGLRSLRGKTVAVVEGHYTHEILRRDWPDISLRTYSTRLEALKAVARSDDYAYVGNLAGSTYLIRRAGLDNLEVVSPTRMARAEISVAVSALHPELVSIVDKVLGEIDDATRQLIEQDWIAVRYEYVTLERFGRWAAVVAAAAILVLLWNFSLSRQIRQRRRAESELAERAARLRLAVEGAKLGIWEFNADSDRYTINPRQAELHGLAPDDLHPPVDHAMRHVQEDDRSILLASIRRLFEGESNELLFEYRVVLPDGEVRWVLSHGRVLEWGDDQRPRRAVGISRDLTPRKRFEESIQQARTLAEEMNRQKSEFLGMAAHDLRNPLSAVSGMAELLRQQLHEEGQLKADDPDIHKMFDVIIEAAGHMLALIRQLLDVERIESGDGTLHRESYNVSALLHDAVELSRAQALNKKIALKVTAPAELDAQIDRHYMIELFDNLINNAVKYCPPAGSVDVSLEPDPADGGFTFTVRDTGPGFKPEDFPLLFKRFQRLSARPTGGESSTGLGLSIARMIAELHGGTIHADNHPQGGAIFTVRFPAIP